MDSRRTHVGRIARIQHGNFYGSRRILAVVLFAVWLCCGEVLSGHSEEVHKEEVLCGMSTAMTGPASDLGINMRAGVLSAFREANDQARTKWRIRLKVLDDGYEPSRTAPNMRQLIEQDNVVAIIGNVGTPTAIAALPIVNSTHTPFFGAYTGAGILRKSPPDRYVINFRASYAEETAAMVDALIEHGGLTFDEIAFFTQRDGYGDAGFVGGIEALKKHGLKRESDVAHGRYERNTLAVEHGLAEILFHNPTRAIIMVGAYAPCAKFITLAKSMGYEGLFLNVSFVSSDSLAKSIQQDSGEVIVTQVVPYPESELQIAKEYRRALAKYFPDNTPTFGSFEGYIAGRILLLAFSTLDSTPTRESTIDAFESLGEFSLGLPTPLRLSSEEHQASHRVWPTILSNGKAVPFDWKQLKSIKFGY